MVLLHGTTNILIRFGEPHYIHSRPDVRETNHLEFMQIERSYKTTS